MIRTKHQKELMGIILREAGAGRVLSVKELYEMCSYKHEATYGAVRVSCRALEQKGVLIRKKVGVHTQLIPTQLGYDWFRPLR